MCKIKILRNKLLKLIKEDKVLIINPGDEIIYTSEWNEIFEEYKKQIGYNEKTT